MVILELATFLLLFQLGTHSAIATICTIPIDEDLAGNTSEQFSTGFGDLSRRNALVGKLLPDFIRQPGALIDHSHQSGSYQACSPTNAAQPTSEADNSNTEASTETWDAAESSSKEQVVHARSSGGRPIALSTLPRLRHSFRLRRSVLPPISGYFTALSTLPLTTHKRVKPHFRSKRKLLSFSTRDTLTHVASRTSTLDSAIPDSVVFETGTEATEKKQSLMLTEKLPISRPISIYIVKVGSQAALIFSQKFITFVQSLARSWQYGGALASESLGALVTLRTPPKPIWKSSSARWRLL